MDNQWKDIFEKAEKAPSRGVWAGIESGLAGGGGKKAFMIPLAWAAAISLALASTILVWYNMQEDSNIGRNELAKTPVQADPSVTTQVEDNFQVDPDTQNESKILVNTQKNDVEQIQSEKNPALINSQKTTPPIQINNESRPMAALNVQKNQPQKTEIGESESSVILTKNQSESEEISDETNESISPIKPTEPQIKEINQDSLEQVLQDSYYGPEPEELQPKDRKQKRRLWAGISQGYGGFASNLGGAEEASFAEVDDGSFTLGEALAAEQGSQNELKERGLLNTALWVGIPINHSMAVMTGFGYSRANYTSTAASYNGELLHFTADPVAISETGNSSYERVDIDGTYDMAFIPVVVDWALLQGQFGLCLQAGPELGILLQQKIKSDETGASRSTGAGNLYRPIHFRMASGVALTYQVKENYQISLQPRATQAITSVTSSDAAFSSYPLNYSVMLGFRYIF